MLRNENDNENKNNVTTKMKQHTLVLLLAALLLTACSDYLFDESGGSSRLDGMQLNISTIEMADELVSIGGTRAAETDGAGIAAVSGDAASDSYLAHPLEGDNPYGLKAYRMPLPLVGIHSAAASAGTCYSACDNIAGSPTGQAQGQGQAQTRASINDIASTENFHDSLTIWGFTDGNTCLYNQILVKKITNWRTSVQWPYRTNDDYMRFYALSPSMETTDITINTEPTYSSKPVFTYKLPETAGEMVDLLIGESSNISIKAGPTGATAGNPRAENLGQDNKIIDLQFRHLLTAVRFSQKVIPAGLKISKIELQGVATTAKYNPETADTPTGTTGSWSDHTGSATYSINTDFDGTDGSGVYIDNNQVFFMLPQTVGSGVKLNITLVDSNASSIEGAATKSHVLSCSLTGDVWKKGYTVNYMITIGEVEEGYYFLLENNVNETSMEHSNSIVNGSFTLHSYHNYRDYSTGVGESSKHVANWSVNGYSNTGVDNFTITDDTKNENGLGWLTVDGLSTGQLNEYTGGYGATVNYSLRPQEYTKEANHETVLGANNHKAETLDLSKYAPYYVDAPTAGTQETANCYIVNREGTYKFPLKYGNKKDNNTEAACFKDHTGTVISHQYIKDQIEAKNSSFTYELIEGNNYRKMEYVFDASTNINGEKFLKGELVWQDVASLIKNNISVTTSPDQTMQFEVGVSRPGNAVLALKARKKITYYTKVGEDYVKNTSQGTSGEAVDGDNWETLWLWHIWMTDEVYQNEGNAAGGNSYDSQYLNYNGKNNGPGDHIVTLYQADGTNEVAKILPVNLGWVPDNPDFGFYSPREGWVELKQVGSNNTIRVKITQHARQPLITGTGTFYQWGRPTPFPAFRSVDGKTVRPIYNINNEDISDNFVLAEITNMGEAVSEPFKVLQGEYNGLANGPQDSWFPTDNNPGYPVGHSDYTNALWDENTKTVYDPCPRGFRMPAASVFYGFSKKTGTTGTAKTITTGTGDEAGKLNMYPNVDGQKNGDRNYGGYFYTRAYSSAENATNPKRYDPMVYIPATGQFHGNKYKPNEDNKMNISSNRQVDNYNGIYWTGEYFDTNTTAGCGLWIITDYDASGGSASKPVFGYFDSSDHKFNYYGTLRSIRPRKN